MSSPGASSRSCSRPREFPRALHWLRIKRPLSKRSGCTASLSGDADTPSHSVRFGGGHNTGHTRLGPLVPASAGAQLTDLLLAGRECNPCLNSFANGAVFCVNCCEAVGLAAGWAATLSKGEPSAKARIGSRRVHENKSKPLIFCQRHL